MKGVIVWPPSSVNAGNLVRKRSPPGLDWKKEIIEVKRFYDTYIDAIRGLKHRLEDTTYETEEEGTGKRRIKRPVKFLSSESEDERTAKRKIPKKGKKAGEVRDVPQPPMLKSRQTDAVKPGGRSKRNTVVKPVVVKVPRGKKSVPEKRDQLASSKGPPPHSPDAKLSSSEVNNSKKKYTPVQLGNLKNERGDQLTDQSKGRSHSPDANLSSSEVNNSNKKNSPVQFGKLKDKQGDQLAGQFKKLSHSSDAKLLSSEVNSSKKKNTSVKLVNPINKRGDQLAGQSKGPSHSPDAKLVSNEVNNSKTDGSLRPAKPKSKGGKSNNSTNSSNPGHDRSPSPDVTLSIKPTNYKKNTPVQSDGIENSASTSDSKCSPVQDTATLYVDTSEDLTFRVYTIDKDNVMEHHEHNEVIDLCNEDDIAEENESIIIKTEPVEEEDEKISDDEVPSVKNSDVESSDDEENSDGKNSDVEENSDGKKSVVESDSDMENSERKSDQEKSDGERSEGGNGFSMEEKESNDYEINKKNVHQNKKPVKHPVKEYTLADVMDSLKTLHSKVDILGWNMTRVSNATVPGEKVVKRPPGLPPFPLESLKDLSVMESFLADDSNLNAAGNYFAKFIISGNLKKSVQVLLKKIVGKVVAKQYSFHGVGSKKKFETLCIWNAITCALTTVFKSSELLEADAVASRWLTLKGYDKKQ